MKRMKRWWSIALVVWAVVLAGAGLASCDDSDSWFYKYEKPLYGEWRSDSIATTQPNGIVLYIMQIRSSDKHAVSPYNLIVKRKDGKYYIYRQGYMGHRNDDPNDIVHFSNKADSYKEWTIRIEWLNKAKTRVVLFRERNGQGIVFHKTRDTW